jgi:hypothetical protein
MPVSKNRIERLGGVASAAAFDRHPPQFLLWRLTPPFFLQKTKK